MDHERPFEERLRGEALRLGFAAVGLARSDAAPLAGERLRQWLDAGAHGEMIWMEERAGERAAPAGLWPEVRSVIALGMSYAPGRDPLALAGAGDRGRISVYAQGGDYHDVVKRALKALGAVDRRRGAGQRPQGVRRHRAGDGKAAGRSGGAGGGRASTPHLVSRAQGSWLFLGAIYTTLDLAQSVPGSDACGSCEACQRACPTDAFPAPYRLDARRCISYLTIEHKGPVPEEFRAALGNRIYGCDDCLAVCPWNKFAHAGATNRAFLPRAELAAPRLADLLALDDAAFRQVFAGSPIKRIGRDRMVRNAAYAAGNSGDVELVGVLERLIDDPSDVVRDAVNWALTQLSPFPSGQGLGECRLTETIAGGQPPPQPLP